MNDLENDIIQFLSFLNNDLENNGKTIEDYSWNPLLLIKNFTWTRSHFTQIYNICISRKYIWHDPMNFFKENISLTKSGQEYYLSQINNDNKSNTTPSIMYNCTVNGPTQIGDNTTQNFDNCFHKKDSDYIKENEKPYTQVKNSKNLLERIMENYMIKNIIVQVAVGVLIYIICNYVILPLYPN